MKYFIIFLFVVLSFNLPSYAEDAVIVTGGNKEEFLKKLQKEDRQAYKEYLDTQKKDEQKRKILESYREGKITLQRARASLRPIIEQEVDVKRYLQDVDGRIEALKKEIEHLKAIKNNPKVLIEETLDTYLGA